MTKRWVIAVSLVLSACSAPKSYNVPAGYESSLAAADRDGVTIITETHQPAHSTADKVGATIGGFAGVLAAIIEAADRPCNVKWGVPPKQGEDRYIYERRVCELRKRRKQQ